MAAQEAKIVSYKGRKYKLVFLGATRFGRRAHLELLDGAFSDGTCDFWVDAAKVQASGDTPETSQEQREISDEDIPF